MKPRLLHCGTAVRVISKVGSVRGHVAATFDMDFMVPVELSLIVDVITRHLAPLSFGKIYFANYTANLVLILVETI